MPRPSVPRAGPEGPGNADDGGQLLIRDQTQLIHIHRQIAGIHARAGRPSQALASREPALAVARRLADAHHGDLGIQAELARAYIDIADLLTTTGNLGSAAVVRQGAGDPAKDGRGRTARLPVIFRRRHQTPWVVLQKCGRAAEAVSAFREAVSHPRGLDHPKARRSCTTSPAPNRCFPASPRCRLRSHGRRRRGRGGQGCEEPSPGRRRRMERAGPHEGGHRPRPGPFATRLPALMMDMAMPAEPFARGD